jgi:membrane protein
VTWTERIVALRAWAWRMIVSPGQELGRGARFVQFQLRLWYFCARRLRQNNAMAISAALSFHTIFAMVPTIALAVVVMKPFGGLDSGKGRLREMLDQAGLGLIRLTGAPGEDGASSTRPAGTQPAAGDPAPTHGGDGGQPVATATDKVMEVVDLLQSKLTFGRLGPIGLVLLIWAALTLMTTMERALNRVFEAPSSRGMGRRTLLYWAVLTLLPVAFYLVEVLSHALAGFFQHAGGWLAWFFLLLGWAQPVVVGVLLLAAVYVLLPNTKVSPRAALGGAVVAFPAWLVARWAFSLYLTKVVGANPLYGSLGLVPLFLMWLNISWLLLLFGAELAHTAANVGKLSLAEQQAERPLLGPWELLAAAVAVAERFAGGAGASPVSQVAGRLNVSPGAAGALLDRLAERHILCRVDRPDEPAYVPARSLDTIDVADFLSFAESPDLPSADVPGQGDLAAVIAKVRATAGESLAGVSLMDLVRGKGEA